MTTPRWSAHDLASLMGLHAPTEEQTAVIEAPLEPMLVVAGAGSGKTDTMASRVVWLIANGIVEPRQILGLTFTRKATHELIERVSNRLGVLATALRAEGLDLPPGLDRGGDDLIGQRPHIATYNGFALDLVREHALAVGVDPEATMLSAGASFQLAYDVVEASDDSLRVDASPATLTSALIGLSSALSDHLVTVDELREELQAIHTHLTQIPLQTEGRRRATPREVASVITALEQRLAVVPLLERFAQARAERGALDFSDQVSLAAKVAREVPEAAALARDLYRVVLLDEFQDTSVAQLSMLSALFGADHPICAVGDPQQAIYGWRGASAASLSGFAEAFSTPQRPVHQFTLSTSWRNDQAILTAANSIAAPLRQASQAVTIPELRPRPQAGEGAVDIYEASDVRSEARAVARWIKARRAESDADVAPSAAVLVRARSQIPALAEELSAEGLPVHIVGLGGLLHRPEVADVRALLECVHDADRGDSLMRLLTGPRFRLGAKDLAVLGEWRAALGRRLRLSVTSAEESTTRTPDDAVAVTLLDAVDDLPPEGWTDAAGRSLSPVAMTRLKDLQGILRRMRGRLALPLPDLITAASRALGTDQAVLAQGGHLHDLEMFRQHAAAFESSASTAHLGAYLTLLDISEEKEAALSVAAVEEESDPEAVTLVTMHSAKGLEWDLVAVVGLTEGSVPAYDLRSAKPDAAGVLRPRDKGWLGKLADAALPSGLRGDADIIPHLAWHEAQTQVDAIDLIDEYAIAQGADMLQEDRRLMYVAVTRARSRLLLSSAAWRPGTKTERSRSRYLSEVQARVPKFFLHSEDIPQENPLEWALTTASWPPEADGDEQARGRVADAFRREPSPPEEASAMGELDESTWAVAVERVLQDLADRRERLRVHSPARVSTSYLVARAGHSERAALDLVRPLPHRPSAAARHGTAFHSWIESRYEHEALLDIDDLTDTEQDAPSATLEELQSAFLASPWADRTPRAVETPVSLQLGAVMVRGVIDAVFDEPEGVMILDWKTGRRPTGARRAQRALQLAVYRYAWHEMTGTPLYRIRAAFHYVAEGITDEVTDFPSREQLANIVAGQREE